MTPYPAHLSQLPRQNRSPGQPLIGITCDVNERQAQIRRTYIDAVTAAGGVPVLLPPPATSKEADALVLLEIARAHISVVDGLILTGGDDPDMTCFGKANHPASTIMHPDRQRYEMALLTALDEARAKPALGICLGMQQMSLHAGGDLIQHMPDELTTHAEHAGDFAHEVTPETPHAVVCAGHGASSHHQAVRDAGRLRIVARARDGIIEAVDDPARPFYIGVQWHPERTSDAALGARVFQALIAAALLHKNARCAS